MADRTISVALRAETGSYEQQMRRAGQSTRQTGVAATGTQRAMGGLGMAARRLIPVLGIAGVARSAGQAVSASIDLESRLFSMQTQIGLTSSQVARFSDEFGRLGAETGKGAQELADASWQIASAGLRGADALDALESAAKASAVGFGEVNTIAGLSSAAVNAYGSEVLSAAEATDVMAAAVRSGTAAPEEIASTMGTVLPIAAEMGVRFDEIGAAQAAMTRTGTDAATSITQLRGILSLLLNPAEGSAKAMAEVGLSAQGLRDTIREDGLWEALMQMRDAIGDNEDVLGRMIPNQRALAGFLDLTGSNAAANAQVFEDLADATGLVDEAHEAWGDTTEAQIARASANWQNFKNNLTENVLPGINVALEAINDSMPGSATAEGFSDAGFSRTELALLSLGTAYNDLVPFIDLTRGAQEKLADSLFAQAWAEKQMDDLNDVRQETGLLIDEYGNVRPSAQDAASGSDDLSGALAGVEDQAEDTRTSVERLTDAFNDHIRVNLDAESAAIRVEDGFANLTDTLEENGGTLDRNTEKGRNNEKAIIDQAGAILDEVTARHEQGDSLSEILPLYDRQVGRLREVMSQAGLTEDEIEDYIETLGLTPEQIATRVIADTGTAESAIARVTQMIGRIPTLTTATVGVRTRDLLHSGGHVEPSGNIRKFHDGGTVGSFGRLASDEVPAILQTGEMVLSRDDTQAYRMMMASFASLPRFHDGGTVGTASAGSGQVVLRFGADFARGLMDGTVSEIRLRDGVVQ